MKKLVLSLIVTATFSLSSFASNELKKDENKSTDVTEISKEISNEKAAICIEDDVLSHDCTYRMYTSSGKYLGTWTLYDCPGDLPCGSQHLKETAISTYNDYH